MADLDIKDKKLLYYLSINCRFSHTQLSRKIGLSKNSVKYRIERLKKEGIITQFATVVNISSLGLTTIDLLIKFNDDIYEKPDIMEYFRNHKLVNWAISLSGQWDLFVEFIVKDFDTVEQFISDIRLRFNSINSYQMFFSWEIIKVDRLAFDFYKDLNVEQFPPKERTRNRYTIDETEKKILKSLNEDSTKHYLDIARETNTSIDVVRYRIKSMLERGIINRFLALTSSKQLGYTDYLYRIKLKNVSQEKVESLKARVRAQESVPYAFFDINTLSIIFVCSFKSADEMDKLSRHLRKDYSEIISSQEYLIIKERLQYNLFPRGVMELI